MSPVAICGTDTLLDAFDQHYVTLRLARQPWWIVWQAASGLRLSCR